MASSLVTFYGSYPPINWCSVINGGYLLPRRLFKTTEFPLYGPTGGTSDHSIPMVSIKPCLFES